MDRLVMLIKDQYQDISDTLSKIEKGSAVDKAQALSLLNSQLLGVSSLEWQVNENGSDKAKKELNNLLGLAKRAKVIRKREKDKAYQKDHIKQIKINLNYETDKDIIEILENKENVSGYIKELIRNNNM